MLSISFLRPVWSGAGLGRRAGRRLTALVVGPQNPVAAGAHAAWWPAGHPARTWQPSPGPPQKGEASVTDRSGQQAYRAGSEPLSVIWCLLAARQPSLAGAVDICVAALTQADVTANVVMPAAEILRDVIVVAVRLVGNSLGRTEMDPARHRPFGRVVDDADMHPVAAAFHQLERDLAGVCPPVTLHVAPAHPAELVVALPDRDGGRRQRGDRRVRGLSFGRSPAGPVVLAGQRLRIGRHTTVHLDIEDAVPRVLRHEPHRTRRRADERVLINVASRDAGDDESPAARDELDPFDRSVRMRIFPAPQVVSGGPSHGVLHQADTGFAPPALETRQVAVAGVGDGEERLTAPFRRDHLDFAPLSDVRDHDLAAGKVKRILCDGLPDGVTGWCARLEQPMRDDHPPRQPPDPDRRRGGGQQQAPLRRRRLRPDQERQAAQVHPPERNITRLIAENLHTGVAGSGQVYWLITRHASDRKASGRADPS